MLTNANSNHQRTAASSRNNTIRITTINNAQRIGTFKYGGCFHDCGKQVFIFFEIIVNLIDDDFTISI